MLFLRVKLVDSTFCICLSGIFVHNSGTNRRRTRILTSTLCKILLPHASIRTIKQKLRNFTEFYGILPITFLPSPITYGSYGWSQLFFLFIRKRPLCKKVQTLYSSHQRQHHAPTRSHNQKQTATHNILTINNLHLILQQNSCILSTRQPGK